MAEKSLIKDYKMLVIEEEFNDSLEDILWRLRQIERKPTEEIARILSVGGVSVSYDEAATWLSYLEADTLIPKELVKPDPNKPAPPPPRHGKKKGSEGIYDPKSSAPICDDNCPSAAMCKFYDRYFGKRCIVDTQAKREFLQPLQGYLAKTYGRDEDLKKIFFNFADQIATIHQLMQRKIRHMNTQGITVIERKTDPSTGKLVENEVPNPLNAAILSDSKQVMSMLKEMGVTPKSLPKDESGQNDPASLSKAMEMEERRRDEMEHLTEIKKERFKKRPEITSKEQLLALIEEKKEFTRAADIVLSGEDVVVDEKMSAPMSKLDEKPEPSSSNAGQPTGASDVMAEMTKKMADNKVLDGKRGRYDIEIPSDLQAIIDNMNNKGDDENV